MRKEQHKRSSMNSNGCALGCWGAWNYGAEIDRNKEEGQKLFGILSFFLQKGKNVFSHFLWGAKRSSLSHG